MSGNDVCFPPQSLEIVKAANGIPITIQQHASYIHPEAIIDDLDQWVYFPPGLANETLLEIPIGAIDIEGTIVITVGLFKNWYNQPGVDRDPRVGISDRKGNYHLFEIHDINDYNKLPPCTLFNGIRQPKNLVSEGTEVSADYKLTFFLKERYPYGTCITAQDGGFLQHGLFVETLDFTEPFYLRVQRDDSNEDYFFRYFTMEVM